MNQRYSGLSGLLSGLFNRGLRTSNTVDEAAKIIDAMKASGQIVVVNKDAENTNSRLDIRNTDHDMTYAPIYNALRGWVRKTDKMPVYGSYERDLLMSQIWKDEPILAGAVYSMTAKMAALRWTITGRRNLAKKMAHILSNAAYNGNGYGWGGFISSVAQDFYTTNNGSFMETPKSGDPQFGYLSDLGHIDSLCCTLTGNSRYPMIYLSYATGQQLRFRQGEYIHFASMPSSREEYFGMGFCAVDRAYRAAKLLMSVHDYDSEKLRNLPPEGVATVTGLTMDEFKDAVQLWLAARKQNESLTFPQVLWLIGSNPGAQVSVDIKSFSQIPESFDRRTVVENYVSTLALDWGVDVREFWTLSGAGGMGSAGESAIQHLKAKGKGQGEFVVETERAINDDFPDDVNFAFDPMDSEEDAQSAAIAKAWIDAFMPLYNLPPEGGKGGGAPAEAAPDMVEKGNPRPDKPNGEPTNPTPMIQGVDTGPKMTNGGKQPNQPKNASQVITKDQLVRLLIDKSVLPDWLVSDNRVLVSDTTTQVGKDLYGDDFTQYRFDKGVLKETRLSIRADNVYTPSDTKVEVVAPSADVIDASFIDYDKAYSDLVSLKEQAYEDKRNITGDPIPSKEAKRGARVTPAAIRTEMALWRTNPILAPYALTDAELEEYLNGYRI